MMNTLFGHKLTRKTRQTFALKYFKISPFLKKGFIDRDREVEFHNEGKGKASEHKSSVVLDPIESKRESTMRFHFDDPTEKIHVLLKQNI